MSPRVSPPPAAARAMEGKHGAAVGGVDEAPQALIHLAFILFPKLGDVVAGLERGICTVQ